MKTAGDTDHVSDLSLDLAVQGELPAGDELTMRGHLEACDACRERYETATADAAHFHREILPRTLEHVTRRLGASPAADVRTPERRPRTLVAPVLAFAALGALSLMFARHHDAGTEPAPGDLLRKGGPMLKVFARHGEHVFVVADGAHLKPGDTLRFVAEPAGARFLMVASIDGANHASVYVPYDGQTSLQIDGDRTYLDDAGIALDGTLGPERIFALFSKRPIKAQDVTSALSKLGARGLAAIRNGGHLDLPDVLEVSLCIDK